MAQELRIDTWCDPCLAKGEHEAGAPEQVALQGHQPRVMDLCKAHRDKLLGPLETALEAWGRRPEGVPKRPHTRRATTQPTESPSSHPHGSRVPIQAICLVCGHQAPSSAALGQHIKNQHGQSVAQMFGATCPLCGAELSSTGMGMHLTKTHDVWGGIAAAFNVARDQGDPHGVVARQEAQAQ